MHHAPIIARYVELCVNHNTLDSVIKHQTFRPGWTSCLWLLHFSLIERKLLRMRRSWRIIIPSLAVLCVDDREEKAARSSERCCSLQTSQPAHRGSVPQLD